MGGILGIILLVIIIFFIVKRVKSGNKKQLEMDSKISVYNITDIGRPYTAINMISADGKTQAKAKHKLQIQALNLNADAIVSYNENVSTKTRINSQRGGVIGTGAIKSINGSSTNTFHVQGTAVKFTDSSESKSNEERVLIDDVYNAEEEIEKCENEVLKKIEVLKSKFENSLINEDEFENRKKEMLSSLEKQKVSILQKGEESN